MEMVALPKIPAYMSATEFLVWDAPPGNHWQLVDGEPQAMAPANRTHNVIQGELGRLLGNHLVERDSPCSVVPTPGIVPRVRAAHNVRIPDLIVTYSDYTMEESTIDNPVLIVEVLSPSNKAETWSNVWTYVSIPSVHEILIVRSAEIGADLLRRQSDGSWPAEPVRIAADEKLTLDSVGFTCPLRALYRTTRLAAR
jgi:Uma2 family endonuclease